MVTWADLSRGLKDVRDHGHTAPRISLVLAGLGWVQGSEADPAGLVLTIYGRQWLTQIEASEARVLAETGEAERLADLSVVDLIERYGVQ